MGATRVYYVLKILVIRLEKGRIILSKVTKVIKYSFSALK